MRHNSIYEEADSVRTDRDQMILTTLGKNVKSNRVRLNLTQSELADKARIHRNYVCNIENGRMNPTILLLLDITQVLGVEIDDLLI